MTQEEHTKIMRRAVQYASQGDEPRSTALEKHHIVAIKDGGPPSDPSNLITLCYMCHSEWHVFFERYADWPAYMAATPYCQVIPSVGMRKEVPPKPPNCSIIVNDH